MTKIIELILTNDSRWTWKEWNPYRNIMQLYTKEWLLVGEAWYEEDWDMARLSRDILFEMDNKNG